MRWGAIPADAGTERPLRERSRLRSFQPRRPGSDQASDAASPSASPSLFQTSGPPTSVPDLFPAHPAMADRLETLPIESRWAVVSKRVLDVVVGLPMFAVFLVAYPVVALVLKITSPGPVIFAHTRIGKHGQPIDVYKFRSMHLDAEQRLRADAELYETYLHHGFKVPPASDPRITAFGRFLRKTSLDELPQALCILNGTMSAVGPRPVVAEELERLYGDTPEPYLACKPGVTGLWQVSGRSHVVHEHRARLDLAYAKEWTLGGDLRILLRTVPVVLSFEGAH
jgi:exopolysaccharide production protein ExoY